MKNLKIAGAYMGTLIGAGFASGQEIIQFFTSFGWEGMIGVAITSFLLAFLAMHLIKVAQRQGAQSHRPVIQKICGKYLGVVVDYLIILFLFGVTVVMLAGAGSTMSQQWGLNEYAGSAILTALVIVTCFFSVDKIIGVISMLTPVLILLVVIVAAYAFSTIDASAAEQQQASVEMASSAPNWFIGGVLYASFMFVAAVALLSVMGGKEDDERVAGNGALLGGLALGAVLMLANGALYTHSPEFQDLDIPMLELAEQMSPVVGTVYAVVLLCMIYSTAISLLYTFCMRVTPFEPGSAKFRLFVVIAGAAGFGLSLIGFTTVIGTLYPFTGYLGLLLMGAVLVSWVREKLTKKPQDTELDATNSSVVKDA